MSFSKKLKELYEHPFFHGIKTEAEAYNLCKDSMEQSGKPDAAIFFLFETQDRLSPKIYLYEKNSEVPERNIYGNFIEPEMQFTGPEQSLIDSIPLVRKVMVERRTPQDLSQIARATIMDSINCSCGPHKTDCCVRNLHQKIDSLRIPESEKVNIRKLIHI